jgi:hypothetical protein
MMGQVDLQDGGKPASRGLPDGRRGFDGLLSWGVAWQPSQMIGAWHGEAFVLKAPRKPAANGPSGMRRAGADAGR